MKADEPKVAEAAAGHRPRLPVPGRRIIARGATELAVIIVGVTVALSADGWAADRKDRAVENARLHALLQNVDATLGELRNARRDVDSAVIALRALSSLPRSGWTQRDLEDALLRGFLYVSVFLPELNVYDDLKNSGELSLLTDTGLRRALSTMDGRMERVLLYQQDMATVQQLNLDPYLIGQVDLRGILGRYLEMSWEEAPAADLAFTRTRTFRNLALFKLDLALQMAEQFESAESDVIAVRTSIRSQLDLSTAEPAN